MDTQTNAADYAEYLKQRSLFGHLYRTYWLYPRLARATSGKTLDVGCGIGDFLRFRPGTIGVDVNPETIAYCRAEGFDARQMQPDVLPFGDGEFDTVMLDNVLEHIAQPAPLLREIARVLKPKGRAVVGVPGRKGYASDPDHKRFYDEPGLVAAMATSGFDVVKVMHLPIPMRWLDAHARQYCLYGVFAKANG